MANVNKYYFNGDQCMTVNEWKTYMQKNCLSSLWLFKAVKNTGTGLGYCNLKKAVIDTTDRKICGTNCKGYDTGFRKRWCMHRLLCYKPTKQKILLTASGVKFIETEPLTPEEIEAVQTICNHYDITKAQLYSRSRQGCIVQCRKLVILLLVYQFNRSIRYATDHFIINNSNFYYTLHNIAGLLEVDRYYQRQVNNLFTYLGIDYDEFYGKLKAAQETIENKTIVNECEHGT